MATAERTFSTAMLLDGAGGARVLTDEEVARWQPADGLLWIDLNLSNKAARHWLGKQGNIERGVADILLATETRPRSLVREDGLVVVMRGINMNPGAVPDDMVSVRMWLQGERIITVRRRKVLSIRDVHDQLQAGSGPKSTGQFLVALTGSLAGRIQDAVENIEDLLEGLGERVSAGDIKSARSDLGSVRRRAAALRRHLAPQRDAIERITRTSVELLGEREVFDLREEGDQLTRQIEDLDLARENALVAQEELMNRIAEEQNARMYVLSIVAAIFLPLSFVTGLLGMNVAGLPGTDTPYGFAVSAVVMVALGMGLLAIFRWKKWI
jgi:zinc transporter